MKNITTLVRETRLFAALAIVSTASLFAQTSAEKSQPSGAATKDQEIISLTPFTVTASKDVGYGAMQASSGRLGQSYIDTPQAVSVVTSELLKDAKLVSTFTAVKFVANVSQTQSGHNPGYNIRGISTGSIFYDGFGIGGNAVMDTAFFDRIEVIKGPATAGYGRGNPAGFLNFVSKMPTFQNSTEIGTTFGTGGPVPNQRVVLDNNGLVTSDGKTAYRVVSVYSRGSATKDASDFERSGLQLAVAHNLKKGKLSATVNLYHNHNPSIVGADLSNADTYENYLYFFYAPGTLPSHKLFPDADTSRVPNDIGVLDRGMISSAALDLNLTENLSTRQAINIVDRNIDGTWSGPAAEVYDPVTGLGRAFVFRYYNARRSFTYNSDFVWKHENVATNSNFTTLFGADYSDSSNQSFRPVTNSAPTPLFPWNPALATYSFPVDVTKNGTVTSGVNKSVYAQVTASLLDNKLRLTVAQRKNYFDLKTRSVATQIVSSVAKNDTPLFGSYSVLYKVTPRLSLYATKSQYEDPASFTGLYANLPVGDKRSLETVLIQPTTTLDEFGIKGSLLEERIIYTVSRYKVANTGSRAYQLLPKVVVDGIIVHASVSYENLLASEGWEFEIFGKINKNLTFMAGGGIQDGTATAPGQPDVTGKANVITFNNDPGDALFARLKYSFGSSPDVGLTLNVGFKTYFKGWTYHYGSTPLKTGSMSYPKTETVTDIGFSYGLKGGRYRIGLDVTNALNPDASVHTFGNQNTESGRLVLVSFDAKF